MYKVCGVIHGDGVSAADVLMWLRIHNELYYHAYMAGREPDSVPVLPVDNVSKFPS